MRRFAVLIFAGLLIAFAAGLVLALLSNSPTDPSFNTVTSDIATNWVGPIGSHVADVLLQIIGWPALALALPFVIAGVRVAQGLPYRVRRARWAVSLGAALLAVAGGAVPLGGLGAPAGFGGLIGVLAGNAMLALGDFQALANVPMGLILSVLLVPTGLGLIVWGAGFGLDDIDGLGGLGTSFAALLPHRQDDEDEDEEVPARAIRRENRSERRVVTAEQESQPAAPRAL